MVLNIGSLKTRHFQHANMVSLQGNGVIGILLVFQDFYLYMYVCMYVCMAVLGLLLRVSFL